MSIIKNSSDLDYILKEQQREIEAYDHKASAYISSNAGLFVIALFTLCIFGMFHGETDQSKLTDISQFGIEWWSLFIVTIVYTILFCISNIHSLLVLFPRVGKEKLINTSLMDKSITNFATTDASNMKEHLAEINNQFDEIKENHIEYNVFILKKKHFHSKRILPYSVVMSVVLLALIVLLFVF